MYDPMTVFNDVGQSHSSHVEGRLPRDGFTFHLSTTHGVLSRQFELISSCIFDENVVR